MTEYWFRPKRYGYGATPTNWKGWAVVIAFVAMVLAATYGWLLLPSAGGVTLGFTNWIVWALAIAGLVIWLLRITRARTDGEWRWRWGKDSH